ncbi:MAG: hypothetical protein HFJ45_03680 [Clostridia bacterium]|nr:hypothetical protein [Clostridia bacterium]
MSVYDRLNFDKVKELKGEIAEAFIQVYGEKNRDLITQRVEKLEIISYVSKEQFNRYLSNLSEDNILGLTDEFAKAMGVENSSSKKVSDSMDFESMLLELQASLQTTDKSNDIFKICFGDKKYSRERYPDVLKLFSEEYFSNSTENFRNRIVKQRVDILNYFGANVNESNYQKYIDNGLLDEVLQKVSNLQEVIRDLDSKRDAFLEEHKQEFMENEKNTKIESTLRKNYTSMLLTEIISSLPEQFQIRIKQENELDQNLDYSLKKFGLYDSLLGISPIEYFSSEYNDVLRNSKEDFKIEMVKEGRIEFFKINGIDLGDDYEEYMNNPNVLSIIPEQAVIDKIANLRKEYCEKYQIEVIKNTGSYQEDLKKISNLGCLEEVYAPDAVYNNMIYVSSSIVERPDGTIEDLPMVFLPGMLNNGTWENCADVAIIHEIGHAIEEELVQSENGSYLHKTGFEFLGIDLKSDEHKESLEKPNQVKREYETLNESIHQQLSIEVTDILHSKGIFIMDSPDKSRTKGSMPSYERAFRVISPFFNEYRQLIVDSMLSEKSFKEFQELPIYSQFLKINSLSREFGSFVTDHVACDYKLKKNTPEVTRYNEIINEVLEITNQSKLLDAFLLESSNLGFQEICSAKGTIAESIKGKEEKDENHKDDGSFREEI